MAVVETKRGRRNDLVASIIDVLVDLAANIATEERYRRLALAVRRIIPCDSVAMMVLDGAMLVPVVTDGLVREAAEKTFDPAEHPRLARILRARGPVRFADPSLPDPFDGLIDGWDPRDRVHACMGCPLVIGDETLGVVSLDAVDPSAFERIDDETVAVVAALCAAALRTSMLIARLEEDATRAHQVAATVLRDRVGPSRTLLGQSAATKKLRAEIELAGQSDLAVLISGETGTGKEVVAHAVHAASRRHDRALVQVNCAALPESIAESELFGHVRGAFTGAVDHRAGKFEIADGGTLFLDEIGELPLSVQPKLLRALQFGEIQRIGADHTLHVDVRIIAATNRDLATEVAAGRFRPDLYHRLSVYPLAVAPLRERTEDIAALAGNFLDEARGRLGITAVRLTPAARALLEHHSWPGNARELEHAILRAAVRAAADAREGTVVIDEHHLGLGPTLPPRTIVMPPTPSLPLRKAVDQLQRDRIAQAVADAGGNWAEAARRLGLDRANLHRLARRLGL